MNDEILFLENLAGSVEPKPGSIGSRTLHADDGSKIVLFNFEAGQKLSEHRVSMPITIQILEGEFDLTLGAEKQEGKAGTWMRLPADLPHSLHAKTAGVMLLTQFKAG